MSKKSLFAGIALTENTPLASPVGPDQRLFASPAPPVAAPSDAPQDAPPILAEPEESIQATNETTNVRSNVPRKQRSKETTNERLRKQSVQPLAVATERWSIKARPGHRMSFDFTEEELDALDDIKRDAKRQHDLRTTKQDLVRHAIHELLRDYEENGDASWILQKLRNE